MAAFEEIMNIDMNEYLIKKKKEYKNKDIITIQGLRYRRVYE